MASKHRKRVRPALFGNVCKEMGLLAATLDILEALLTAFTRFLSGKIFEKYQIWKRLRMAARGKYEVWDYGSDGSAMKGLMRIGRG